MSPPAHRVRVIRGQHRSVVMSAPSRSDEIRSRRHVSFAWPRSRLPPRSSPPGRSRHGSRHRSTVLGLREFVAFDGWTLPSSGFEPRPVGEDGAIQLRCPASRRAADLPGSAIIETTGSTSSDRGRPRRVAQPPAPPESPAPGRGTAGASARPHGWREVPDRRDCPAAGHPTGPAIEHDQGTATGHLRGRWPPSCQRTDPAISGGMTDASQQGSASPPRTPPGASASGLCTGRRADVPRGTSREAPTPVNGSVPSCERTPPRVSSSHRRNGHLGRQQPGAGYPSPTSPCRP